jgi:hypothetical protein
MSPECACAALRQAPKDGPGRPTWNILTVTSACSSLGPARTHARTHTHRHTRSGTPFYGFQGYRAGSRASGLRTPQAGAHDGAGGSQGARGSGPSGRKMERGVNRRRRGTARCRAPWRRRGRRPVAKWTEGRIFERRDRQPPTVSTNQLHTINISLRFMRACDVRSPAPPCSAHGPRCESRRRRGTARCRAPWRRRGRRPAQRWGQEPAGAGGERQALKGRQWLLLTFEGAVADYLKGMQAREGSRELHTGLSPDKFALCSPRTGHPGNLFRRSRNGKKNGRPFVRWPELRPDKSGPAQTGPALPARSPTEAQWPKPAPAEHPRSSSQAARQNRRRPRAKSSQAARQNRRRPRAKRDAARQVGSPRPLICPGRSRAPKAQEEHGAGCGGHPGGQTGLNVREPSGKKN